MDARKRRKTERSCVHPWCRNDKVPPTDYCGEHSKKTHERASRTASRTRRPPTKFRGWDPTVKVNMREQCNTPGCLRVPAVQEQDDDGKVLGNFCGPCSERREREFRKPFNLDPVDVWALLAVTLSPYTQNEKAVQDVVNVLTGSGIRLVVK